jgi:hypothetical protein
MKLLFKSNFEKIKNYRRLLELDGILGGFVSAFLFINPGFKILRLIDGTGISIV